MMKDEYNEMIVKDIDELGLQDYLPGMESEDSERPYDQEEASSNQSLPTSAIDAAKLTELDEFSSEALSELDNVLKEQGIEWDDKKGDFVPRDFEMEDEAITDSTRSNFSLAQRETELETLEATLREELSSYRDVTSDHLSEFTPLNSLKSAVGQKPEDILDVYNEQDDYQLEQLRQFLPAFSDARLQKTLNIFGKALGNPHLLDLVDVARERMPDYVTATWLKQMSALTAKYAIQKVTEEGQINTHILNGALELQTSAGCLEGAVEFYSNQFESSNLIPTGYSDRLVLQMFLKNNRLQRALAFKQTVEENGRKLDVKSYGSLIDYFGHRNQLGSAMLLLKECVSVHNAPPGEASLAKFRMLYRRSNLNDVVVTNLIGPDPVEWLRHGEATLKREMSKKGRRDVVMARNQAVRL
jgi:hypothetical protein